MMILDGFVRISLSAVLTLTKLGVTDPFSSYVNNRSNSKNLDYYLVEIYTLL